MKKIISILMVVALLMTVLTVGMATTTAAETATITIYGLDGTSEVKEVNVGDEFTVYTTLNASASAANGMVSAVDGTQTYSSDVLTLVDEVSGAYGEFADTVKVFPVTGDATMANASQAGKIVYNASTPAVGSGFKFDSDSALLIVTTYQVKAAGAAEVKNALKGLAAADSAITKIVFEGKVQEGKSVAGKAYYDDPTPAIDHAEVRLRSLDGSVETKSFNVGDTFNVYTTLDASTVNGGLMGSVNGVQRYTSGILELADSKDEDGYLTDTNKVFPVMKDSAMAIAKNAGSVKYVGSSTSGFLFNNARAQLLVTTYRVKANGYADITNKLNILAAADDDITRLVFNGEKQDGVDFLMPSSFSTDGPIPTLPPGPTEPNPNVLTVTLINPDGSTAVKEVAKNKSFYVYTVLNAGCQIASLDGTQTFTTDKLSLSNVVEGDDNEIKYKSAMFPILKNEAVATANNGVIKFNASRGAVGGGYPFNTDTAQLIVTKYKALANGTATIKTTLKTLIKDDEDATKIVFNGATQSGQSYKMVSSFTEPGTEEPTQPATQPSTEPSTQPPVSDKAVVTIYGVDGTSKTATLSVGDTFTVYSYLDASQATAHGIASISASQTFTSAVLQETDEVDNDDVVVDTEAMFPILGSGTVAKITSGLIKYNASVSGVNKGYVFNDPESKLIVTNYKVIANGNAEVRNILHTVAADDSNLTKIVYKDEVQSGKVITGTASFYNLPEQPTQAPTEKPTQAPTEPSPDDKAKVTVYGFDGSKETKYYAVGETFTVYSTFDASQAAPNAMIASFDATQTFTTSVLQETDSVDSENIATNPASMFPVFGDKAMARIARGKIQYNASTPNIGNGFVFKDNAVVIVSHYKVRALGTAKIKNVLTTVAAADAGLTRIVSDGVVADGKTIGGIATFTNPGPSGEGFVLGDVDGNGYVDSVDSTYIKRYAALMDTPISAEIMERNGDVDGSGYVDVVDSTFIDRYLAQMDVAFPIDQVVYR